MYGALAVDVAPMADPDDQDDEAVILDRVQDAVLADADAPDVIGAAELHGSCARIGREGVNPSTDAALNRAIELRQRLRGGGQELDGVHASKRQPSLELLPADPVAVRRVGQGGPNVIQVVRILERFE